VGKLVLKSQHRIICGDSTDTATVDRLFAGGRASLLFTSPPYGQQRDYGKAKELVSDWEGLMRGVFQHASRVLEPDGQVLVNLGLIHRDGEWIPYWDAWIAWMREQGWRRFGWYVWDQGPGMPGDWGGRLAPSHEFIFHLNRKAIKPDKARECKHAGEAHGGKGQRGKDGVVKVRSHGNAAVQPTAIFDSVVRVNRQGARTGAGDHPAPFPVGLASIFLQSWPGLVYEPFGGSGTTLIAAHQLGRRSLTCELEPTYCDIAVQRWENLTKEKAVRHG
jgi:DNA modification methylase